MTMVNDDNRASDSGSSAAFQSYKGQTSPLAFFFGTYGNMCHDNIFPRSLLKISPFEPNVEIPPVYRCPYVLRP